MSSITVRPTVLIDRSCGGDWATYGWRLSTDSGATWGGSTASDAQILAALNDNNTATRLRNVPAASITAHLRYPNGSVPAGDFVARITSRLGAADGQSGRRVGMSTYLEAAGVQAALIQYVDGSTTPVEYVSTQPWSASGDGLASEVYVQGSSTLTNIPQLLGAYVSLLTITKSTCVPTATTLTTTNTPTVPVQVTSTVGWESGIGGPLNTVTVETRIESGGTGVGTGTLLGSVSQDFTVGASGAVTVNAAFTTALPNGSYLVYARATRYREDGLVRADQVGAWSASGTLTVNVTPPAAPTVTVGTVGQDVPLLVTPQASAGYTAPRVKVLRSVDGVTWAAVRGTPVAGTFGTQLTVWDYEAPRGVTVTYRVSVLASASGAASESSYVTVTALVPLSGGWNLRDTLTPANSVYGLVVTGATTETISEDAGVFRPLDRAGAVVVSGQMTGWDGELTIHTTGDAEWAAVKALVTSGKVLLLQSGWGWVKYVRFVLGSGLKVVTSGTSTTPRRDFTIGYVETVAP